MATERANGPPRLASFPKVAGYRAFEHVLADAHERFPVQTMAYQSSFGIRLISFEAEG